MKLTTFTSLLAFAFILLISSCKPDEPIGALTIQFKAKYGNQSFALNSVNTDPQGRKVKLSTLKFFLSHITLVKNDNSTHELKEAVLLDFSNPNSLTYNFDNVKGDFKAIKFGCGLDSVQNLTNPNLVEDPNNPLSNSSMYWSWIKYIFEQAEGYAESVIGSNTFDISFSYMIGTDAMYRQTEVAKNFSVCCNKNSTVTIWLDVEKIFHGSQTLNIVTQRVAHMEDTDDQTIAPIFVNNFSTAFSAE